MAVSVLIDEDDRVLSSSEALQHAIGRSLEALLVGGSQLGGERRIRDLDGQVGDVGRDLDVHWALLTQAGVQGPVEFLDHVHRGNAGGYLGKRCDGIEHVGKVAVGKRVVQVPAELGGVLRRSAGDGNEWDVLCASTCDAV